jgi:tetratricopeptide (TPR) repeat protein
VVEQHGSNRPVQSVPQAPAASVAGSLSFQQALATLVSPQAAFGEKQLAWTQLRDTGKLDQAIVELEKSAVANPTSAEYPATLGQAYLQKAGTLKDIREQGILGMKADQSFDAALTLDSANWDAAFWKASAMSYWPPQLGKTQEVLDRFTELAKQQETLPAQPQFAQTYVLLGEQYQKLGQADYASQVWQHGAALFPNDPKLAEKISGQPAGQPAAR